MAEFPTIEEMAIKIKDKTFEMIEKETGVSFQRLVELAVADREGRCVVMPCKVGDKIYEIVKHRNSGNVEVIEYFVNSVEVDTEGTVVKSHRWRPTQTGFLSQKVPSWVKLSDFGKTVFLTREEAEKALKERKNNG